MLFEQENNLYGNGWIDLVFAKRNQMYGAYVLRKEYSQRLTKALALTMLIAAVLVVLPYWYVRAQSADDLPAPLGTPVVLDQLFQAHVSKPNSPKRSEPREQPPAVKAPSVSTMPVPADVADKGEFMPTCPEHVRNMYTKIWTDLMK